MRTPPMRQVLRELDRLLRLRAPLEGAPRYAKPNPALRNIAEIYAEQVGREHELPTRWAPIDVERGQRIARAYDQMADEPHDPLVSAAWTKMGDETLDQLDHLVDRGYKFDFIPHGQDPYGDTPHRALEDLRANRHLWVHPTEAGFGSVNEASPDNPLLRPVRGYGKRMFGGAPFVQNDAFRAVHDALGHAPVGAGFRAPGEENAFLHHRALFSDLANVGLTAETRGQNSWVNFGPYMHDNLGASQADTVYADQKNGLMPEWVYNEGTDGRKISLDELRRRLSALLVTMGVGGGVGAAMSTQREAA